MSNISDGKYGHFTIVMHPYWDLESFFHEFFISQMNPFDLVLRT